MGFKCQLNSALSVWPKSKKGSCACTEGLCIAAWLLTLGKGCITFSQPDFYTSLEQEAEDRSPSHRITQGVPQNGGQRSDNTNCNAPSPIRIHDSAGR